MKIICSRLRGFGAATARAARTAGFQPSPLQIDSESDWTIHLTTEDGMVRKTGRNSPLISVGATCSTFINVSHALENPDSIEIVAKELRRNKVESLFALCSSDGDPAQVEAFLTKLFEVWKGAPA